MTKARVDLGSCQYTFVKQLVPNAKCANVIRFDTGQSTVQRATGECCFIIHKELEECWSESGLGKPYAIGRASSPGNSQQTELDSFIPATAI